MIDAESANNRFKNQLTTLVLYHLQSQTNSVRSDRLIHKFYIVFIFFKFFLVNTLVDFIVD